MKFLRKKEERQAQTRPPLDVIEAPPERGLTAAEVERRRELGYANTPVDPPGKTVKQIIFSNVFTFFNLIFFLLAACIIAVRSWNNLMFMGVVICNTVIGIVQELRSKRTLDQLNLLTAPQGSAVRDGNLVRLNTAELVRDDVVQDRDDLASFPLQAPGHVSQRGGEPGHPVAHHHEVGLPGLDLARGPAVGKRISRIQQRYRLHGYG